jgi:hypothetical protein
MYLTSTPDILFSVLQKKTKDRVNNFHSIKKPHINDISYQKMLSLERES